MTRIRQFKLPDLGEGLTEGEILKWLVGPGDEVRLNQPIVEVETAKAAVEVPSPFAGVVTKIHHPEGETVDVGVPIIEFDTDPGAGPLPAPAAPADDLAEAMRQTAQAAAGQPAGEQAEPAAGERTPVLVGYGVKATSAKRRPRVSAAQAVVLHPEPAAHPPVAAPAPPPPAAQPPVAEPAPPPVPDVAVLAKPPVRKLAKDLGVDLRSLTGTGPHGTITRSDVELAAGGVPAAGDQVADQVADQVVARFDASREQRIAIKGVRKHTAAAVTTSAFTAPHVTEFLTVDVTPMMRLRAKVAKLPEFAEVRVSPLLFVAKALLIAAARNPMINSSWDEERQEIVVKDYVNLGIAASTPRGLIVPNVKDAGRLTLRELAGALQELTDTARAGRTTPADMSGGTITITNVGVFGVDAGTPILTPGESAILAFGAVNERPWVHKGRIRPRQVTTLALSFDHRVVDGDLGSRFLADIGAILANPVLATAWT